MHNSGVHINAEVYGGADVNNQALISGAWFQPGDARYWLPPITGQFCVPYTGHYNVNSNIQAFFVEKCQYSESTYSGILHEKYFKIPVSKILLLSDVQYLHS